MLFPNLFSSTIYLTNGLTEASLLLREEKQMSNKATRPKSSSVSDKSTPLPLIPTIGLYPFDHLIFLRSLSIIKKSGIETEKKAN